jgi:chromosome partitioning protein
MRSVAVTNAKGGVGKSTTAINLSTALADLGKQVLLIDADPSGNATLGLFPTAPPDEGLADLLLERREPAEVIRATGVAGLDVVASGRQLGTCSDQMGGSQGLGQGREFRIRRVLRKLAGYDVVVLDTSPVQTPLNVAILYAVGEVLIPIDPCIAALAGVRALESLIHDVSVLRQEFTDAGPLVLSGVLITRLDRTLVARQIESEVRAYFGPLAFDRSVPTSVKFREAYARGIPLIHYDPWSAGADAYRAAAEGFLERAHGVPARSVGTGSAETRPMALVPDDSKAGPLGLEASRRSAVNGTAVS